MNIKRLQSFFRKEFRHILRDRRTLLILFGMPLAQVLLFGFVLSNEIKNTNIAVLDQAKDAESIALTNKLVSSGYFRIAHTLESARDLEPAFRSGKVKMAFVFSPGFGHQLAHEGVAPLQIISDASDPNTATTLLQYAQAIVQDYQLALAAGQMAGRATIQVQTRMQYNPEQKAVFTFVPGVITLILMLVSAMMTSITIAREKELGTMEVLLVSPLQPLEIILGKTSPYLLLSLVSTVVVILVSMGIFGMPIRGSLLLLAMECILYTFVALSLGILISTRAKDQMTAMFMSALGLLMPTMLLSGFIFPRESMPWALQVIGMAIPATWFNPIVKGVMIKGVGLEVLWLETVVLAGMALFFLVLSLRNFKDKLE
ncbi:MAG: ABC transporter permease [Saprospiraceae bacterium]|nr:ABC transporter permease [Saprospiraceae bacterium]